MFDCKFIETSASLHHNVRTLFEGIVRQIRLRRDSKEENARRMANCKRRESISKKAKRFLGRMVARKNKKMAFRQKSKSCHDLSVLWARWTCRATKTRSCVCFLTLTQGLDNCTEISLHIFYCKTETNNSQCYRLAWGFFRLNILFHILCSFFALKLLSGQILAVQVEIKVSKPFHCELRTLDMPSQEKSLWIQ